MTTTAVAPWGLTRMKPFPASTVLPCAAIVLDPDAQTGQWITKAGDGLPMWDRHKRSETSKETSTKTSLDGNSDQGSDQSGDSD
ncbi:putative ATP-grasp-modified RiPP [Streptomyces sp. CA-135486]|uniref:putative ATP-grasp-modified RiPP n=1 Tax=Streptomyces sp. CA-135486 TaxID=3240049 RepID=UPI003D9106E5